jgi:Bacterial Ig-like domain (group 3)
MAHYAGDGTYGGSYSAPVSVSVSKENSTVILGGVTPSGSKTAVKTVSYDSQYFVRADVGNSQGSLCSPLPLGEIACPSGSLIFTVDGTQTNLNSFELNNEGYTETEVGALGGLTGGTHTLGGQYSGDDNYNASAGTVQVTVTRAATNTIPVTAQGAITQSVTLTTGVQDPNAAPTLPTPTGTVTFYSNGTIIPGTPTYSTGSNGIFLYTTATQAATFRAPGTYTLTASYSGDQNYQPSSSSASQVTLQYPQPTVSATPASQTVPAGTPVTITVLADTGIKTQPPTGTVSFINSNIGTPGPTSCTQTTDASGNYACQATFTFTPPPPSESTVDFFSVQYSGDTNYPASQSGTYWIYISDFLLSSGTGTVTVAQGQSQQATINVSALSGFNGTVSNFSCSGLPAETQCNFNPTSAAVNGSTTVTIATTSLGQSRRRIAATHSIWWGASGGVLLLGICLIGIPSSTRHRSKLPALMILVLFMTLPGCGGGGTTVTNNPVPSISSLSPTQAAAGSAGQTLTVNGSGFIDTTSVTYNGTIHTATLNSASQLSIQLTTADITSTGTFPVIVTNPSPGGGSSSPVDFSVVTGTPTGTFTVTVTASSGSLTNSTNFTLVVQ